MDNRTSLKHKAKTALLRSGVLSLAARLLSQRIAVLKYHSIQEDPEQFAQSIGASIIHPTAVFKEQMELVAAKFDPVSMDDILLFLRGEKRLPRRPVAITFDDGFHDNFEIAAPILNRAGVPASFYVTVHFVDLARPPWFCRLRHAFGKTQRTHWTDPDQHRMCELAEPQGRSSAFRIASEQCARKTGQVQEQFLSELEESLDVEPLNPGPAFMMNWDQIRSLRRMGHIVGSHTLTHPNMAHVQPDELELECRKSKIRLEEKMDEAVVHFSYPSPILQPHWSDQTVAATRAAGYQTGVTSDAGPVQSGQDPLALKRVAVPNERTEFLWALECSMLGRQL